jgi:hypothetical protein
VSALLFRAANWKNLNIQVHSMSKRTPDMPRFAPSGYEFTREYRIPVLGEIAYYVSPTSNRPCPFKVTTGFLKIQGQAEPSWILKKQD